MKLFGLFRRRGDLTQPGPQIVAGKLPPLDVAAMREFGLPQMGNIHNLEYYRSHRGQHVASPPRGTRDSPGVLHPTQSADIAERPVSTASPQSGPTPNPLVSTTQNRSVSQPPRSLDSSGAAAPTNAEGA